MHPDLIAQQSISRVKRYEDQQRAYLHAAIDVGTEVKHVDGIGKEYYAFSNHRGDTILNWVDDRVKVLLPDLAKRPYSVTQVCFDLTDKHVFKVSGTSVDWIYVSKKRFKRFIKKAVTRALY